MILKENILKLEIRRKIYNFILKNPGLHLRELSRKTKMPKTTLRHHPNFLEKYGLIITKADHRYTRYYVIQKVGKQDKEILNLLRQETPRRIFMLLLTPGPGHIFKDEEIKKKAFSKFGPFLKMYSKKELVELTRYWHGPYAKFFHLRKHQTTINFHLNKFLEIGLIEKVKVGREIKYKFKDEDMIWAFFVRHKTEISARSIDLYLNWQNDAVKNVTENLLKVSFEIFPYPYHA